LKFPFPQLWGGEGDEIDFERAAREKRIGYGAKKMEYQNIITKIEGKVGVITLNRPKALNALNSALLAELIGVLEEWDRGTDVHCIVITGSDRAFAAGADIKEMAPQSYMDMYRSNFFAHVNDRITAIRKPIIAAVAGYALGGGCELAMLCDFIIAADTAKFGQPEINLGVMPGIGGTQRLTRFVGKSKAMEMCLTGRNMDAAEAERGGLVSRVVPAAELLTEAMKAAQTIAEKSVPIAMMTKEAVNVAYETTMTEGVRFERRVFHAMFATEDQKEGMAAFREKRKPGFVDK
jgi:enoyl-CoA hydratase